MRIELLVCTASRRMEALKNKMPNKHNSQFTKQAGKTNLLSISNRKFKSEASRNMSF